jgi:hypothetical protein
VVRGETRNQAFCPAQQPKYAAFRRIVEASLSLPRGIPHGCKMVNRREIVPSVYRVLIVWFVPRQGISSGPIPSWQQSSCTTPWKSSVEQFGHITSETWPSEQFGHITSETRPFEQFGHIMSQTRHSAQIGHIMSEIRTAEQFGRMSAARPCKQFGHIMSVTRDSEQFRHIISLTGAPEQCGHITSQIRPPEQIGHISAETTSSGMPASTKPRANRRRNPCSSSESLTLDSHRSKTI